MTTKEITIGTDYAAVPGGRFIKHGDFSGEAFRKSVLVPSLQQHERVVVYLDGTSGYAGSFLEEAFGGLIREEQFSPSDLAQKLDVRVRSSKYEIYRRMVQQYLNDAAKAKSHAA